MRTASNIHLRHAHARAHSRPRVLVLDDDPTFLALMEQLLVDEGYRTLPCSTSEDIHERVRNQRPDLAILDLRVEHPETGLAVLELLRREPLTGNVPVIICSADRAGLERRAARLEQLGCDVLAKPFDLVVILEMIRAALGSGHIVNAPPELLLAT